MAIVATILDLAVELVVPWIVLLINIFYIPKTVKGFVKAGQYSKLFSASEFRSAWFANFWAFIGPSVKEGYQPDVAALLQGRVLNGKVHDHVISEPVSGVVLEVGAGNGAWIDVFAGLTGLRTGHDSAEVSGTSAIPDGGRSQSVTSTTTKGEKRTAHEYPPITKIFGVEPNPFLAATLRRQTTEAGIDTIYEVVPVGIEEVGRSTTWREKIPEGSIDSIVCICCLCSIPNPEETIKALHRLLKPGGRWYIHEHVLATRGGPLMRAYQYYFSFFYAPLMGGCQLCRPTLRYLLAAGPFSEVDIVQPDGEPSYKLIPRIIGVCTR